MSILVWWVLPSLVTLLILLIDIRRDPAANPKYVYDTQSLPILFLIFMVIAYPFTWAISIGYRIYKFCSKVNRRV